MSDLTWDAVLDDLERRLEAAELALDHDQPLPIDPFVAPADIAPLPDRLRRRALTVLGRQTELEARVENLKQALAREMSTTRSAPSSPFTEATAPRYFDSRA